MGYPVNRLDFAALNGTKLKRAKANIHHAANWIIGGLENTMMDHPETSDEYKDAKSILDNHSGLVQDIYSAATTELYDDGFCGWGPEVEKSLKDIRFLGKETLLDLVEKEVVKQGY